MTLAPVDVLEIRASIRAFLWWRWLIEMPDAVDPLQEYAESTGLVTELGQDAVQAIIAAPFARLRALAAAREAEETACDAAKEQAAWEFENEYAARLVRQWELADPRDRWRHTGELPPAPTSPVPVQSEYRPPRSVIDAFWLVARGGNADALAVWLADHPLDAQHLHNLWEAKCSTAAA
jgi:hypothetical protein